VLQKKMNEIYTGKSKTASLPPIQIQAPSMTSVLDMLNIINGILFVQISPRDIENFKVEFEKRQQQTSTSAEEGQQELEHQPEQNSTSSSEESKTCGSSEAAAENITPQEPTPVS